MPAPRWTTGETITETKMNQVSDEIDTRAAHSTLTAHINNTSNPHSVTKAQVGLGNVDNTSDANKPVSTAQATAIAAKENILGNPAANGYILSSTTAGVRSWIAPSGGGGGITTEDAQDAAAAMITAGTHTGVSVAYNDAANTLSFSVTGGGTTDAATISVLDHGADRTGVALSHAAINAATAALPAAGGTVVFPAGTYLVDRNALTLRSDLRWFGVPGQTVIKLRNTADGGTAAQNVNIIRSSTTYTNITFDGIVFDGNGANQSDYPGDAATVEANRDTRSLVVLHNVSRLTFVRCGTRNGRHGATIRLYRCDDTLITQCEFRDNGVSTVGLCDHTFNANSSRYQVIANRFVNATDTGTAMDGVLDAVVLANVYENNALGIGVGFCNVEAGHAARSSAHLRIVGNTLRGPNNATKESQGIKVGSFGHAGDGLNNRKITIADNDIGWSDRAIWAEYLDDSTIHDNTLHDAVGPNRQLILLATAGSTVTDLSIADNDVTDATQRGVFFSSGTTTRVRLRDNRYKNITTAVYFSTSGGTHTGTTLVDQVYRTGVTTQVGGTVPGDLQTLTTGAGGGGITTEDAQDAAASLLTTGTHTGIAFTYDDAGNRVNATVSGFASSADLTAHTGNTSNPHSVTKAQVGLANVTNDAQLKIASNLSDLNNAATARTNLGAAAASHTHAIADLPVAPSGTSNTTQLVRADDARLSDARTPTAHTHAIADVTNLQTTLNTKSAYTDMALTVSFPDAGTTAAYVPLPFSGTLGTPTERGTGTLAYAYSTDGTAAFNAVSWPLSVADGGVLRITPSGVTTYKAATIKRTA